MAGSYLGQLHVVGGQTDRIDLSNSLGSSAFLHLHYNIQTHLDVWTARTAAVREGSNTHVHVHPDAVLPADVRNGDEGVKGSVYRRTRCGAYKERYKTLERHKQKLNITAWNSWRSSIRRSSSAHYRSTFCLASSILLSRSAGIILPLQKTEKKQALVWVGVWTELSSYSIQPLCDRDECIAIKDSKS